MSYPNQRAVSTEFQVLVGNAKNLPSKPLPWVTAVKRVVPVLSDLALLHTESELMTTGFAAVGALALWNRPDADCRLTADGKIIGDVHYLAPEQILGEPVDTRTDVYQVGALLYRLTTGWHAFDGDSNYYIMQEHLHHRLLPPVTLNRRIPPALNYIISNSLERHPDNRYQSAIEMKHMLDTFINDTIKQILCGIIAAELTVSMLSLLWLFNM